ncbi:MAG: protoporphyrinogen oxidase [Candidatus Magasanikbacteria bacterium]|nr:protoporphyrinogen oxidase [Candidatus Magasanikbacteria bacterium]
MAEQNNPVLIIGAGPAGLTASYELAKRGVSSIVLEKDSVVGGIARTAQYKGYRFDIGGHRFFTKVERVKQMWQEILDEDFLKRPRLSHIYYKKKFFQYPIKPMDVLRKLGFWESALAGVSYSRAKIFPRRQEESFEDYIVNHFGLRLYNTFFKSYTEKVWGLPCTQIKAEWAAQRIKGLSLTSLIKTAFLGNRGNEIKSLIEQFHYPRFGPGMMWEKVREKIEASGLARVIFNTQPVKINHENGQVRSVVIRRNDGQEEEIVVSALISSMPLTELFPLFNPALSECARSAASILHYRDFLTIALIVNRPHLFDDNWIYIHEPNVEVGRIQNYKNWSPEMLADQSKSCLGLEYFCFKSDPLWTRPDAELLAQGAAEVEAIGLANKADIEDGTVIRMEKTYPVYDDAYEAAMPVIRQELAGFKNFYTVGRNGMHRYNNQDHAMYTAMLAVENLLDNAGHDLWSVNVERVYHEEQKVSR